MQSRKEPRHPIKKPKQIRGKNHPSLKPMQGKSV
jgi:hypothetical protein